VDDDESGESVTYATDMAMLIYDRDNAFMLRQHEQLPNHFLSLKLA